MTLRHYLNEATALLSAAHIDAPRLSAQVLAAHALCCTKLDLTLRAEEALSTAEISALDALMQRRASGEPVAYITGQREFYGRNFAVTPATLIPRPETEEMIEAALTALPCAPLFFADIGTGSGCIAVTLAAERPLWHGVALDISPEALHVAAHNARALDVAERVNFLHADLQRIPLPPGSLDVLISNPPYVTGEEYATLSHEVRDFEPCSALTPERTGLAHIKAIAAQAPSLLKAGGLVLVEHGFAQGAAVHSIFTAAHPWKELYICKDLAGLDRYCLARL